ncbi:MAG: GNAT family N-acetyltransferase [Clostridiales bacterium]|nr:GNAT family N-acetyltransferase [Clostridiales bacterium]
MIEPITTNRLILRPYKESDWEQVIWILRNGEISKTFMLPEFEDDAAAERLFRKILNYSHQEDHFERAICLEDRVIGFLNNVEIKDGTAELGYVIHPDYQNRGYATEALTASIHELFRQGYSRIRTGHFEENPASRRVMEKSGMHPISRVDTIEYRGKLHKCLYFEIEREETL